MKATYVYVSGPISSDPIGGARRAIHLAAYLDSKGFTCFVPHLYVFADAISPRSYEEYMRLDLDWLRRCDVLLRLPGISAGADLEVREANRLGIKVFTDMEALIAWSNARKDK